MLKQAFGIGMVIMMAMPAFAASAFTMNDGNLTPPVIGDGSSENVNYFEQLKAYYHGGHRAVRREQRLPKSSRR